MVSAAENLTALWESPRPLLRLLSCRQSSPKNERGDIVVVVVVVVVVVASDIAYTTIIRATVPPTSDLPPPRCHQGPSRRAMKVTPAL